MKKESHIHLDITVPFVYGATGNILEAPSWLQSIVYPHDSSETNPIACFLQYVKPSSNVHINIHVAIEE